MGLANLGNSCYINSVIHGIQGLPKVFNELVLREQKAKITDQQISFFVYRLLKALNENKEGGYAKYVKKIKKVEPAR